MASIPVTVKHQGKKYEIEVDPESNGEVFKLQVFSVTNVEPDRQKIIIKGGQLKDDSIMSSVGLKAGQTIMMMGTPNDGTSDVARPEKPVKFVEDMTEAEAAAQDGATPSGLVNLGNTCYLNSTLQVLRSMPELQDSLAKYTPDLLPDAPTPSLISHMASMSAQPDLAEQLAKLYSAMAKTQQGVPPINFVRALRSVFPQFAERAKNNNGYAQQDAEEAWSQIISALDRKLRTPDGNALVRQYMAGELSSSLECDEQAARDGGEQPVVAKEPFFKLDCHIGNTVNHLRDGLAGGLTESIEKKSEVLDREAVYTKKSEMTRLPKYLTVHFVRFFWKRDSGKKAKIMRKVTFPHELDVVEFCAPELRKMLVPVRDKVREIRKDEVDNERARKRRKKAHEAEVEAEARAKAGLSSKESAGQPAKDGKDGKKNDNDGDTEMAENFKTDAEVDAERDAALAAAKKELYSLVDPGLLESDSTNQTGLYELCGVVTHQGTSADSGHYTAYVKKSAAATDKVGDKGKGKGKEKEKKVEDDGNWWWFNDDKVSEVTPDKIDALAGGGQSHSALILLYRAVPLPQTDEAKDA